MRSVPLSPAGLPPSRSRWWVAGASVLLHLAVLAALLTWTKRPELPQAPPSYDLVFEGPAGGAPSPNAPQRQALPPAQPADMTPPPDAVLGPPAPTPLSTPDPNAATAPPPAADAAPPPVPEAASPPLAPAPTPARTAPTPASAAPPRLALAPPEEPATIPQPTPLEAPPTLEPPAVRLELPATEAGPAPPEPIMPQPPPPLPPVEPQPRPRPIARPAPRPALGTLSNPMDLSLGPAAPRPAARGLVASRSLDLSPPSGRDGPASSDPYAQIRAANASADWNRGLLQYWLRHRYYPEQAREGGEQGAVTIQLTVNRSGRVESVEVLSRSGSQWLDMAAVSTWRDARLPPFTNEMREERITFPIPIQYYLVR